VSYGMFEVTVTTIVARSAFAKAGVAIANTEPGR
jgi:hypothetical protein